MSMEHAMKDEDMTQEDTSTVAIIGLGYVGLPLAQAIVRSGTRVLGFDTNQSTVKALLAGRTTISDLADADIAQMLELGFTATSDPTELERCSRYVICVPTPLSSGGGPDLGAVVAATRSLVPLVAPGDLVVLESTTYPGTTEDVLAPLLAESSYSVPNEVMLAFSPERVDPGNPTYGIVNTPKVVGGLDEASTLAARHLYEQFCETVIVAKGVKEAELAKLLENTYRHVNIALINELAQLCHELDIDVWDTIRCAASKPFGFQAFYPGPGVGGHCIPIDPNYLSHHVKSTLGQSFRFIELAQDINYLMPSYVVDRIQDQLNDSRKSVNGARVLLLGVTYKANVADSRETPSKPVAQGLLGLGAQLSYWDPYVPDWNVNGVTINRIEDLGNALRTAEIDQIVLLQKHEALNTTDLAASGIPIFDTRGVLPESKTIVRL